MRLVLQDLMENRVNGINSGENIFVKVFNLSFKKLCQKREFYISGYWNFSHKSVDITMIKW